MLINGNHDRAYNPQLFEGVYDYLEIKYKGQLFILFHYPILKWKNCEFNSIHLHGHIHSNKDYNQEQIQMKTRCLDIGVDANNYKPISIDEIMDLLK